jgi:hypothetical protein
VETPEGFASTQALYRSLTGMTQDGGNLGALTVTSAGPPMSSSYSAAAVLNK